MRFALNAQRETLLVKNKVFVGPCEIAGQYRNITLLMNQSGIDCEYYTFYQNKFQYGGDIGRSKLPSMMRALNQKSKNKFILLRLLYIVFFEALRVIFFLRALIKYDYFYFGFGLSLLRYNLDLPILSFLNKRVVMNMAHGSDMCPDYIDGALMDEQHQMPSIEDTVISTRHKRLKVRYIEKWSSCVIGSPLSSSFLAGIPFVDIIKLGRVCQAQFNPKVACEDTIKHRSTNKLSSRTNPFRIVHIPSHAPGKGSNAIRDVVMHLKLRIENIDYVELKDLSNDEVLVELGKADLLIDQMYSDLPLSGLGMESLVLGTPVLVSGYGLKHMQTLYSENIFPPSLCCEPEELLDFLGQIIEPDFVILNKYKAKMIRFFEDAWSLDSIAARYKSLILGLGSPKCLFHDPRTFTYLHGYGLSEPKIKSQIVEIIDHFGVEGLSLSHRTDLINSFLKLTKRN